MSLMWLFVSIYHFNYMVSGTVAIELSIIWAFFLNNKFTFSDKIGTKSTRIDWLRRLAKYNVSALSGESINLTLLFILTSVGLFYLVSEAIAILVVFVFNFVMSSKWVWADLKLTN